MANNHMLKRKQNWDYRQRCIYMVTVTVAGPQPILGRLTGDINNPAIELSAVAAIWWPKTGRTFHPASPASQSSNGK